MPIDAETLIAVTQTTFLVHASLDLGETVGYLPPADPVPRHVGHT
jgi:hypothetical protein